MNCHHFNNVSRTFQDLNESIAPADFHLKELNNCVLYFHLVFDDGTKFPKLLESIKVDDDLNVQLKYNGMPLPLPQWFVQGHNATLKKVSYYRIYEIPPPTTTINS